MERPFDLETFKELLCAIWRDASLSELGTEHISCHRHADHWRVRRANESFVLHVTDRPANAQRVVTALEALRGETFAPQLLGWRRAHDGRHLIAMEDVDGLEPRGAGVQQRLEDFLSVIRRLHAHEKFQRAVAAGGRGPSEDSSRQWAEQEWWRLQAIAPDDTRVPRAARWLERVRRTGERQDLVNSLVVSGHGDMHRGNWRLSPRGPVVLDWEEVRRWPLASELADFIVFADLSPTEVAERYGAPDRYGVALGSEAAACALSFYLYWLRTLIDGSERRLEDFAYVERVCERLFAG